MKIAVRSPGATRLAVCALAFAIPLLVACGKSDGSDASNAGQSATAGATASVAGASAAAGSSAAGGSNSGASGGAATIGGASASAGGSASTSAGAGGSPSSAGSGGAATSAGSGGAATSAGSGGAPTSAGGAGASDPLIPAIVGTCPTFTTGKATIAGLSDISLQVGPKKQGSGSLIFYWHGTGSSAAEVSLMPAAVRQEILEQGGIIVAFEGSLGTGGDCSGTKIFSKDDFKVADLIAACAVRDHAIDPRRIFTTGCSAGGLQAGCMGALRSSYIAATAPNSGGEISKLDIQDPSRVPAVMTMHGGDADKVVVSFATTSAAYDAQMKAAGSFVINCNHGGGHCGAPAALQTAAWAFMKDHPFGVAPEPYASALPAAFPSYCSAH